MMDQSTQVNFPIVVRKIKRQQTVADLNLSKHANSFNHVRTFQYRPKSLDLPKFLICSDQQLSRLSVNDFQLTPPAPLSSTLSVSRERTPPFSCSSSVASNCPSYEPAKVKVDDENSLSSKCYCRPHINNNNNDDDNCGKCPPPPPSLDDTKDLSWRRLHMSRAKLKATSTTSELLSGFAMVAMVELQINEPTNVPEWLFITFAICTTILVAIHIFALMISTYILPNLDAIAKLDICDMVIESPHERMRGFIELAWAFSTVLGLFLFLVEVALLCWMKFWDYSFTAAAAGTIIIIPVLIIFILFSAHFYHSLVVYKCDASTNHMEQLENMKKHLDHQVTSPV